MSQVEIHWVIVDRLQATLSRGIWLPPYELADRVTVETPGIDRWLARIFDATAQQFEGTSV